VKKSEKMKVRLKQTQKINIHTAARLYPVMQSVLMREGRAGRGKEHLWVVSLDIRGKILGIELVSLGTVSSAPVEPMEVYSVPLQCRATQIIMVHNHPSGDVTPSSSDIDITDRIIQCGILLKIHLTDHLIISENKYYSFCDNRLMEHLKKNSKYKPAFITELKTEK
jgi:DNA repair protein RadC